MVSELRCCFCLSTNVKLVYKNRYHKFKKNHGPVDFYRCLTCFSGITFPVPSAASLADLYASFSGGMSKFTREIREKNSLFKWYNQCTERAIQYCKIKYVETDIFKWIDIGSGNGEIARIMAEKFPNSHGFAADFHERPHSLTGCKNVTWIQCDLNHKYYHKNINHSNFDIILSITVIEHVADPSLFVNNMFKMLTATGVLYITSPDIGSIAAKILKRFWPYLIFGEHINIPSKKGMYILIERSKKEKLITEEKSIVVKPTTLSYPITYYLDHFHLKMLSGIFSNKRILNINTGILEAVVF